MEKPVDDVYAPGSQSVQKIGFRLPVAVLQVPAMQLVHTLTPFIVLYVPVGQGVNVPLME